MELFQHSVLDKYLKNQNQQKIDNAYSKFKDYFHNPKIQQNIWNAKEEQFQEGFLRELFVKILGYTINPNPDFNLTTEKQLWNTVEYIQNNRIKHDLPPLTKKVKLSLSEETEWMQYFNEQILMKWFMKLYRLSEEEIKIIEGS